MGELRIAVLNRRLILSRLTPRLALVLARRPRSVDLYDYSQRRLEIGLTSNF
jgi:hypothetical protein